MTYTISVYKIDQRCEVIFFQDNDKNHCIALATELFFEEDSSEANRRTNWRKRTSRLVYFICANGIKSSLLNKLVSLR
jgi:hypothetical protein